LLQGIIILSALLVNTPNVLPIARAQTASSVGTIAPSTYPLLFGSSGNVEIDIPKSGIAVRIEIPREFLQLSELPLQENDTHFITSNIRNDYYYYNLVDESKHWTYDWQDNASDGPCFKPNFSYYDNYAPYCLEIWNYLTSPLHYNSTDGISPLLKQPQFNVTLTAGQTLDYTYLVGVDYCQPPNIDKFVFGCFSASPSAPKFVLFHGLSSPRLAGLYNFTLSVANRTNILGYPDFVHAWNSTLSVPVSMAYNAGSISGNICDAGTGQAFVPGLNCKGPIRGKGIVYALQCLAGKTCSVSNSSMAARAYVDQSMCKLGVCGRFNLTGLAPGSYIIEGSAGVDNGLAFSLTQYGYPTPIPVYVSPNSKSTIQLPLRRAPLVCGSINYFNVNGINPIRSLTDNSYLIAAGFRSNPNFNLNITVEGADPSGHVFRFQGVSSDTFSDSFNLTTGVGVKYVGTDPYGTEFAGLPAPEDVKSGRYSLSVNVWVSGYVQPLTETVLVFQSPGIVPPSCSSPLPPGSFTVSPNPVPVRKGGVISGTLRFCNTFQTCTPESPHAAQASLPIELPPDTLFGGNIIVEAFNASGLLTGVTVINGTLPNGKTTYANSTSLRFYVTGFSEYYNHSLSGAWHSYAPDHGHDVGLPDGTYTLQVFMRGYELTSTRPASITILGGGNQTVTALMTRGGAFQVTVGSADNRFGTRAIQARLPWRFLNSSIPVSARVYFYAGGMVGYVDRVMVTGINVTNGVDYYTFTVLFAGQNWSLREIWFYGLVPTHITNNTYTISAYTLGYVSQFQGGITLQNTLVGFAQGFLTLFYANEVDITVPIFNTLQTLNSIKEYDHAIGQVFSGGLYGAEMSNLSADIKPVPTLQFNVFGFGAMQLSNTTKCQTNVTLSGRNPMNLCGQGHFFYVDPTGTRHFDYGLDVGNYTAALPEFGFTVHYLQVLALPAANFDDLFLQVGVFLKAIQMGSIFVTNSAVQGWTFGVLNPTAPLSWAQVQAINSTYSRTISTSDGNYGGVGALFLPGGLYNVTFTDLQYQSQTVSGFSVGWGNSYSLPPPQPLCPTGSSC
jgi:hypothetical protein